MTYLQMTMSQLSNILHNVSQHPSEKGCNDALNSIKQILNDYIHSGGEANIKDYRD
ncbi:hypothetical protein NST33_17670 [Paenibacillus sp. FSL L8-0435]|uniref:hypothetical protein n=1 Tax=Paenibacillus sp. FSL L8-0435 TaxID=2954618 RepID=UPI0030DABD53